MKVYDNDIAEILFNRNEIQERINELGAQITADYNGEEVFVVSILRGSMLFVADLVREMDLPVIMDTMAVSSYYDGTETSGKVKINKDLESSITGKNVLIVEDIVDTGITLKFLLEMLKVRGAKSIKICSFLSKPSRRKTAVDIDYIGFDIEDYFVVGYGLDYNQKHRNYPHLGRLKEKKY